MKKKKPLVIKEILHQLLNLINRYYYTTYSTYLKSTYLKQINSYILKNTRSDIETAQHISACLKPNLTIWNRHLLLSDAISIVFSLLVIIFSKWKWATVHDRNGETIKRKEEAR